TVGETGLDGLLKAVDPKKDIRLFDFGVGYDVNTKLLNKLADNNHGTSQYVEPDESLEVALSSFYDKIKSPVLSNVKLNFDGIQVKDIYPRNVKDIFAGSQVLLMGKYKGSGDATCHMTGTINGAAKAYNFPLKFEKQELGHSYLPRLWAMRRIAHLTEVAQSNGETKEVVDEIIALSKKYGIISNYTSFLVTDPSENHRLAPVPSMPLARPMAQSASFLPPTNASSGSMALRPRVKASWHQSAREVQITDDRPIAMDFRSGPGASAFGRAGLASPHASMAPSAMSFGAGAGGDGAGFSADAISGKFAVEKAKQLNSLKDSIALDEEKKSRNENVKSVDDKTFYLRSGFWTDSSYDASKSGKIQEITFGSKEYFDLLKSKPGISKYLAIGRQLILVFQGQCYKISFKQNA
ncbi:MAG: hypothetical protein K2X81_19590, partial [Candidatus Obscuribacterales bacterium]|nr:hypothetical protein [Candidatus Obscuribacterales bacterium]